MELPGTVTNVVPFGVFVDVHVGRDGLIPRAMLARQHQHPMRAPGPSLAAAVELSVGEELLVQVVEVDVSRKRLTLRPAA